MSATVGLNKWGGNSLANKGVNPFSKNNTEQNSEEKKTLLKSPLKLGGIKPIAGFDKKDIKAPPPKKPQTTYYFAFGTGEIFESTQDPKSPFCGGLKLGGLALKPKPQQQISRPENDDKEDDSLEFKSEIIQDTTGEENDEVLLSTKARLFEFVKPEKEGERPTWAERGSGEFHFNKMEGGYRMTMRRKEMKTICLNARVFKGTKPLKMPKKDNALRFNTASEQGELTTYILYVENQAVRDQLYDKITQAMESNK